MTTVAHGLHYSITTASKTSALAVAASVTATQMSVTPRTPRILSGETFGYPHLPTCLSSQLWLPNGTCTGCYSESLFPSEEVELCEPSRLSWSWVTAYLMPRTQDL